MAFKCEICKARDAKRQYIGSVLNGVPEKELYICNECYEKLTPKLTWESLAPLLTLQQSMLGKNISVKNVVTTTLATIVLKIYDKIENKILKVIPDFFEKEMTLVLYINNKHAKKAGDIHSMSFCKPYIDGSFKIFPILFDEIIVNIFMSLDPYNDKKLINLVMPEIKKYFAPAFNYIGIGVDYNALEEADFFDCLVNAVDLIDAFADKDMSRRITEDTMLKLLSGEITEKDLKSKKKKRTVIDAADKTAKTKKTKKDKTAADKSKIKKKTSASKTKKTASPASKKNKKKKNADD